MKFKIDDRTGIIKIEDFDDYWDTIEVKDLKEILQAVKKTQAKLECEIEIQDSENKKQLEKRHMHEIWIEDDKVFQLQPKGAVCINDLSANPSNEKIAENQKIVDKIKESYSSSRDAEWFADDEYSNTINKLIKSATGKDIEELL